MATSHKHSHKCCCWRGTKTALKHIYYARPSARLKYSVCVNCQSTYGHTSDGQRDRKSERVHLKLYSLQRSLPMVPPITAQVFIHMPSIALRSNRFKYHMYYKIKNRTYATYCRDLDGVRRPTALCKWCSTFSASTVSRPIKGRWNSFSCIFVSQPDIQHALGPAAFEYLNSTFGYSVRIA